MSLPSQGGLGRCARFQSAQPVQKGSKALICGHACSARILRHLALGTQAEHKAAALVAVEPLVQALRVGCFLQGVGPPTLRPVCVDTLRSLLARRMACMPPAAPSGGCGASGEGFLSGQLQ